MIISIKDTGKLIGITILMFCAILVCTMFLNYNLDLSAIASQIKTPEAQMMYDALTMSGQVISAISGGVLLLTSAIMLCFYIKHYIDVHKKELGICKAMGYANWSIAKGFWGFGCNTLLGGCLGYASSYLLMPSFYAQQNEGVLLPEVTIGFHPLLFLCLVVLPSLCLAFLAILYAHHKIACPTMLLLKNADLTKRTHKPVKPSKQELPFLKEVRKATLHSKKSLMFFVLFASFCFSAMMQMLSCMSELTSDMMAVMVFFIGLILSCTTLFLALSTVVEGNAKTISMMRVFGYSFQACRQAILNGYRPLAYAGFAIGTIYQYAIIQIMVQVIFKDFDIGYTYSFSWPTFWIVLLAFIILYEGLIFWYTKRMQAISLKQVMIEA